MKVDRALGVDPEDHEIWIYKGKIFTLLGRFEETVECFGRALEVNRKEALGIFRGYARYTGHSAGA